ncbi:hypothetical protein; putative 2-phosphosulfolactate phosphatase (EC 3.1.3.71)(fragment) [Bradyrhizobium sp. ORS 278]
MNPHVACAHAGYLPVSCIFLLGGEDEEASAETALAAGPPSPGLHLTMQSGLFRHADEVK